MKGVTTAMFRDLPVARLSAALEATKPSSRAAADTFFCVELETEPRPDRALEAVDFDTPAFWATSARVLISRTLLEGVIATKLNRRQLCPYARSEFAVRCGFGVGW